MSSSARIRRWRRLAGVGGLATLVTAGMFVFVSNAEAASVLTADFESGSTSGWSKSGGTWSIVSDGSQTLRQTNASSENAREFAGDASWTDYTVSARVKPLSFGSGGYAGLLARSKSSTTFYRVAVLSSGVQLQAVNSGSVTVLASASRGVAVNTWHTVSLTASGSTISASFDGASVGSGTSSVAASGRIGLQTAFASAGFDDVTVSTSGGTTTPPTTGPTTGPTTTPPTTGPTTPPTSGAVYAAPNGSDSAAGTQAAPTTITSALTRIAAGGTIYLRGGTYNLSTTVTIAPGNNGTSSARKTLSAYPGETPVLNFSAMAEADSNRGLAVNGNYWHIYGITVQRAGDNGIFVGGSNNVIERIVTAFNHDSGLQISRIASDTPQSQWPANNQVISSESHDNADSDGEDADGFAAKLTAGPGNVFQYDVSHNNIDDGWDLYTKDDTGPIGPVTILNSLSYNNGTLTNGQVNDAGDRNGFKLGGEDIGVNHNIQGNIAYHNGHHGFTYNSNPGSMTIAHNASIDNAERNFSFDEGTSTFTGNTSCRFAVSGSNDKTVGTVGSDNQFWTGTNGSRCTSYSGSLGWSFASNGHLTVTFGGTVVTP
ncbi:cellulose-binding protein [Actinoplanes sp. NPDC051411]|uniref:cellulose-binding protein n=1 Tax=Actinoplanes sp. NPDC051411 TaxID=3155522 RepID=UPI00342C33E6